MSDVLTLAGSTVLWFLLGVFVTYMRECFRNNLFGQVELEEGSSWRFMAGVAVALIAILAYTGEEIGGSRFSTILFVVAIVGGIEAGERIDQPRRRRLEAKFARRREARRQRHGL